MSGGRSGSLPRGLAGTRSDDMPGRDGSELARMPASALGGILVPPGMVPFALEPPRPCVVPPGVRRRVPVAACATET